MKKILALCLSLMMVLALAACGSGRTETPTETVTASPSVESQTPSTEPETEPASSEGGNALVVYFSWSGNLEQMSAWVADEAGADRIRVETADPYPEDYNSTADRAKDEQDNGIRPEITVTLTQEELDSYDTIFFGFPVWWYDLPMPMWTFLESYDFSGKTIIPFFSHEGSSTGASSLDTVTKLATGATVRTEDALSIRGGKVADSERDVRNWVDNLEL
jgi:flavodoxin/predicted small lipoprotein YifL